MATPTIRQLEWLAGIIEGEGCFGLYRRGQSVKRKVPRIALSMSDLDVILKASRILRGADYFTVRQPAAGKKLSYTVQVCGARAIGWMMALYPLMGRRRQAKIREILAGWRAIPLSNQSRASMWSQLARSAVARNRNIVFIPPTFQPKQPVGSA